MFFNSRRATITHKNSSSILMNTFSSEKTYLRSLNAWALKLWKIVSFGLGKGLTPHRQQDFAWTNVYQDAWQCVTLWEKTAFTYRDNNCEPVPGRGSKLMVLISMYFHENMQRVLEKPKLAIFMQFSVEIWLNITLQSRWRPESRFLRHVLSHTLKTSPVHCYI